MKMKTEIANSLPPCGPNGWFRLGTFVGLLFTLNLMDCRVLDAQLVSALPDSEDRRQSRVADVEIVPVNPTVPALQHRLFPGPSSLKKGDGVTYYYRALGRLRSMDRNKNWRDNRILRQDGKPVPLEQQTIGELWNYASERKLSPTEFAKLKSIIEVSGAGVFDELRVATSFSEVDWGFDSAREKSLSEYISFLLPDIQDIRHLARFLSLKAKIEITEGRYDDATETLRVGFVMSKSVEKTPFLVSTLVGLASANLMLDRLGELITKSDAPCYYWPIDVLPAPLVNVRKAMVLETEYFADGAGIELLQKAESSNRSADSWRTEFHKALSLLLSFQASISDSDLTGLESNLIALRAYPIAKRDLLNWGYVAERVDAMPVAQVLAIHEKRMLHEIGDEILKLQNLEYNEFSSAYDKVMKRYFGKVTDGNNARELLPVAKVLLPPLDAALQGERRVQNRIRFLQVLSGIRLHVGQTGRLPNELDEIKVVKIPESLTTGKPFRYQRSDEGYELFETVESDPYFNQAKAFRLKLKSAKE